jgi:hypothetical protein
MLFALSLEATCSTGFVYSKTLSTCVECFYGCDMCIENNYYSCILCKPGRGLNGIPISGMC